MPVELFIGKDKLFLQTADVGMSGIFVGTERRAKEGEFVRLAIDLPFADGRVELLGRVTSVRASKDVKRPSGIGVAFYGNGVTERDAWQRFVREIERRHPESVDQDVVFAGSDGLAKALISSQNYVAPEPAPAAVPPALPKRKPSAKAEQAKPAPLAVVEAPAKEMTDESSKADRRRFQRFEIIVEVKAYFDNIEDLVLLHTRDLSQGGMFIATTIVTAPGERLTLRVVHPDTKAEFPIPCVVRRCVNDGEQQGLAVEFQVDEAGRKSFWSFIDSAVVVRTETRRRSVNYF